MEAEPGEEVAGAPAGEGGEAGVPVGPDIFFGGDGGVLGKGGEEVCVGEGVGGGDGAEGVLVGWRDGDGGVGVGVGVRHGGESCEIWELGIGRWVEGGVAWWMYLYILLLT